MDTPPAPTKYKNYRFPVEIVSHAVRLYFRFCLSFHDVEEILLERGIVVTYEAIRKWCRKFGQQYANQLRRRRPRPDDKWHLDEVPHHGDIIFYTSIGTGLSHHWFEYRAQFTKGRVQWIKREPKESR